MKILSYKTLGLLVGIFLLTFAVGAAIGTFFNGGFGNSSIKDKAASGKPINILLMGIDARGLEENSRSDTMIVASIDPANKKVAMVWVPRDTRIKDSKGHYNKINSVNIVNGPEAACETVSDLLGIDVEYYMVTNFEGFADIVDTLGGVTIDVEDTMHHYDPDPRLNINLKAGVQELDGQNALRYVRYRGGPTADIGRTGRQQKFIKALASEMFKTKTILKLPVLVPQLVKNINTNIPMSDLIYMVKMGKDFDNVKIITQTLPGYPYTDPGSGASYWLADEKLAGGIFDRLFSGENFDVAQDPPTWVTEERKQTSTKPVAAEDVPMAEDATLDEDFGGGSSLDTGTSTSTDDGTSTQDNTANPGDQDDSQTVTPTPVNPQDNNQPVSPAPTDNNADSSPQPSDSSQTGPTGSAGY